MNKRIICIALLPFCMGCLICLKGNALYVSCFFFFSLYLLFPIVKLKENKRNELVIRSLVIAVSFTAGYLRTMAEIRITEKNIGRIEDGAWDSLTETVTNAKTDGSAIYLGNAIVYASNAVITDASGKEISEIKPGDRVRAEGKTYLFDRARNEGEFDSYEYYISQKIYYGLNAESIILLERPALSFRGFMWDLKEKISEIYGKNLPPVQSALICAIALGDKTGLDEEIKELYRTNGLSHMLVISGLHISLIGLLLYKLLQGRTPIVTACVMAACGLILYGAVTGFSVSTVRAVTMFCIYLWAAALGCGYDGLSSWSVAIFGMLLFEPLAINNSGFVMSFYQTGFIMCLNELVGISYRKKAREFGEKDPVKLLKLRIETACIGIKDALFFTVIMTLSTYPLIACFYYELPVYSLLANFLLLPTMGLVMVSAIAGGLVGLAFPPVARILLYPVKVILGADTLFCEFVEGLPGATKICGYPGVLRLCLYFALFFLLLVFIYKSHKKVRRRIVFTVGVVALLLILVFPHRLGFEMDFLDVGQGDGIFISASEGDRLFIDGGSSSEKNIGKYTIMPFLKYKGVDAVDYWFVSHLDSDHYNGLSECIDSGYEVKNLVLSEDIVRDESFDELMYKAREHGVNVLFVKGGDKLVFSDTVIEVLWPESGLLTEDKNESSMVLLYEDNSLLLSCDESKGKSQKSNMSGIGFRAFFGGDIGSETEKRLVESGVLSDVTLYKASHHGSKYSNSKEFLEVISPDISVISCSLTNKYGHPGAEAVENMESTGSKIYYTMYSGQVKVKEYRGKLYVFLQKH